MGQNCCVAKDENNGDLRNTRASKKGPIKSGQKEVSVFHQVPQEPEFVVTRRDSIGMAAKEHTEKLMGGNGDKITDSQVSAGRSSMRKSEGSRSTELNTNGLKSSHGQPASMTDNSNVYMEGTFAGERSNLPTANQSKRNSQLQQYLEVLAEDTDTKNNPIAVSFGGPSDYINNQSMGDIPFVAADDELDQIDENRSSCISIRDIQEVRDKVPASPATKLVEPKPHFK